MLGITIENPLLVGIIAVGWLVLLAALFLFGRPTLPLIELVALLTTLFDLAEVASSLERSNSWLALLAFFIANE